MERVACALALLRRGFLRPRASTKPGAVHPTLESDVFNDPVGEGDAAMVHDEPSQC